MLNEKYGLRISIPTRGRVTAQQTLRSIPESLHGDVLVFAPADEVPRLMRAFPLVGEWVLQHEDLTISKKRAWMLEYMHRQGVERTLMLDDDLFFYVRREDVPDRLRDARPDDVELWLGRIAEQLTPEAPHAGFGPRQGNQNFPTGWLEGGRMMLALGYHIPTVLARAEHGRIETREDMDVCLQLLRQGLPNHVTHEFAVGQKQYGAPGGCSGQRTLESSNADAERLAELHPGLVRVVEKDYKGAPRKEVVVSWKKALAAGRAGAA